MVECFVRKSRGKQRDNTFLKRETSIFNHHSEVMSGTWRKEAYKEWLASSVEEGEKVICSHTFPSSPEPCQTVKRQQLTFIPVECTCAKSCHNLKQNLESWPRPLPNTKQNHLFISLSVSVFLIFTFFCLLSSNKTEICTAERERKINEYMALIWIWSMRRTLIFISAYGWIIDHGW